MTPQEIKDELLRLTERYRMDEGRRRISMVDAAAMGQPAGNAYAVPTPPESGPEVNEFAYLGEPTPPVQSAETMLPRGSLAPSKIPHGSLESGRRLGAVGGRMTADRPVPLPVPGQDFDMSMLPPGYSVWDDKSVRDPDGNPVPTRTPSAGDMASFVFNAMQPGGAIGAGAKAVGGAAHVAPGAAEAAFNVGLPGTWWHGISPNKLRRPLEEMSASYEPTTQMKPRQIITPSDVQGEWMVPLIGDKTGAGSRLTAINEQPLAHPVEMQGGPGYMRANDALWASQKGAANTFHYTRAGKLAEQTGKAPLAVYTAMSPTGGDYAHMTADALIGMLPAQKVSQKNLAKFRTAMKKRGYPIPEFSPDNIEALRKEMLGRESGRMREAFVQEMGAKPFQDAGFPDVGSARYATTEPALLHDPSLSSGYMIGRTAPGQPTVTNPAQHMTYDTQIPGQAVGGFEYPLPKELMWLDYYRDRIAAGRDPKTSNEDYAFRLKQPSQRATQEWVDKAEEYQRRRREQAQ